MIRVEEVSDASRLSSYRAPWDSLIEKSPHVSMFDTFEWLTSWIEAFWKDRPLRFLFFWNDDELRGIAPLLADERGDVWCSSSLICPVNLHGNRASVICSENPEGIYEALLTYLQHTRNHVRLAFRNVLATTPLSMAFPMTVAKAGMSTLVFPSVSSPIVRISGDWPSYLKSRSSHLAKEVKRKVKQFQNAGRAEISIVSHDEQCDSAMQDILHIEKRSWKEERGVSLECVPRSRQLYDAFAHRAAKKGFLRSYFLHLDSKPVVYVFGVVFHNEYFALRTSFDSEYKKLSPGIVLFDRILNDAFEEGRHVVDFGPGDESRWKHDFANDTRTQVNVCAFSPWSMRCHCCGVWQQRLKPFVKSRFPALVKMKNQFCPKV